MSNVQETKNEPVYESWAEWLIEKGIIGREHGPRYDEDYQVVLYIKTKIYEPIPVDIGEKLGLKPER